MIFPAAFVAVVTSIHLDFYYFEASRKSRDERPLSLPPRIFS